MALAFLWKLSICKSYNTKVLHPLLLREEPQYSLPLNCKTGVSLPPRVLKNGDPWRPPHSLPFLCSHKGLIHHIPLTLSLSSQRPSHILPFLCNHKASYIWLFLCPHKSLIHHIHLTFSLPPQRPKKITYILPFLCNHKGFIHHIHLTFCLPSQRPHTSHPLFAFTKTSYTTYILPFLCHHKGLQLLGGGDGGVVWLFGGAVCPDVHIHLILVASRVNHPWPSEQLERAQPQRVQLARECKALPSIMHIYSHRSVRLSCKGEIITTLE